MSSPGKGSALKRAITPKEPTEDAHPDTHTTTEDAGDVSESGKFRQLLGLLKKAINVKDLASIRLSLPATLMEPIGNLEYWQYADRPDVLAAIPASDDDLERFLAVLRWTFTKDLKFVKHKIAKPFNSVLGEHFRCHWQVIPATVDENGLPVVHQHLDLDPSPDVLAAAGRPPSHQLSGMPSSTSLLPPASEADPSLPSSSESTPATSVDSKVDTSTRVVFLNEQTCHHPPISFFQIEARGPKGTVIATGADQLSAKFTGTTVKVYPGPHNFGIFVNLPERGEEYQITHPTATIAGLLRGSPYVTIGESCFVTCRKADQASGKKLRAIILYHEESWLLKPKYLCEGVIYEYEDEDEFDEHTKPKHVPKERIVATLEGNWRGEVRWKRVDEKVSKPLIDLTPLAVVPKSVPPLSEQSPLETQRVWETVTRALLAKDWSSATKAKLAVEQAQRVKAEERKKSGEKYEPLYFLPEGEGAEGEEDAWDGRPVLSDKGKEEIEREFKAVHKARTVEVSI